MESKTLFSALCPIIPRLFHPFQRKKNYARARERGTLSLCLIWTEWRLWEGGEQWQRGRGRHNRAVELLILLVLNYLSLARLSSICLHLTTYLLHPPVCLVLSLNLWGKDKMFYMSFFPPCPLAWSIPSFTVASSALLFLPLSMCCSVSTLSVPQPPCKVVPKDGLLPASPAWLVGRY